MVCQRPSEESEKALVKEYGTAEHWVEVVKTSRKRPSVWSVGEVVGMAKQVQSVVWTHFLSHGLQEPTLVELPEGLYHRESMYAKEEPKASRIPEGYERVEVAND